MKRKPAAHTRKLRADSARNRQLLIDTAKAGFAEIGLNASLEEIARRAGVGIGTLYRHFPSREAVVEAVYRREVEQLAEAVPQLLETSPPGEALHKWMHLFVDYIATKRVIAPSLGSAAGRTSALYATSAELITRAIAAAMGVADHFGLRSLSNSLAINRPVRFAGCPLYPRAVRYNLRYMSIESEFQVTRLLETEIVGLRNIQCSGACRHRSVEECVASTHLVFPYRGVYLRHVGGDQTVADANQVLFFNADEGYQISHPIAGGDSSLSLTLSEAVLRELSPAALLCKQEKVGFQNQHLQIDARAQALVALLRHSLDSDTIEPLEAETLVLTLVSRCLGIRRSRESGATRSRRRLADRIKVLLASDLSRRWSLAEIGQQIGGSPVYLTQVFQKTEGMPLYRYHLRLRLARGLDMIARYDDLSALGLDLGFSSHSHFSSAFRQAYGRSPTAFKQSAQFA